MRQIPSPEAICAALACDLAQALLDGRPARLCGELSLRVVEALNAFAIFDKSILIML